MSNSSLIGALANSRMISFMSMIFSDLLNWCRPKKSICCHAIGETQKVDFLSLMWVGYEARM